MPRVNRDRSRRPTPREVPRARRRKFALGGCSGSNPPVTIVVPLPVTSPVSGGVNDGKRPFIDSRIHCRLARLPSPTTLCTPVVPPAECNCAATTEDQLPCRPHRNRNRSAHRSPSPVPRRGNGLQPPSSLRRPRTAELHIASYTGIFESARGAVPVIVHV